MTTRLSFEKRQKNLSDFVEKYAKKRALQGDIMLSLALTFILIRGLDAPFRRFLDRVAKNEDDM